ncbi:hypothetical protein TcasGA2_TC008547 [Tribolium castaneum]|uniref:Uncharacterized protein n=1 Tax=Tribolium castaneum TaxID=7070 RepID=D7EI77_TRICA|nr:PREDICTED: uncharacterized protein LOC655475 [Tribolium castaneum]EFA11683.1 hypothetical protein TcasGA2_TC008547 [Tribolium castaneum]|eukprot:XP_976060.1 PREDICTED: uncharacterized protein LOC655475 [Tribolium castaneum]
MNSMFSSPAIHVFSQENVGSVAKKPRTTNTLSRKPFFDRAVNANTPDFGRNVKREPQLKKPEQNIDIEDDDLFIYDTYSFKDMNDDFGADKFITAKEKLNKLRPCCGYKELTPSPKLSPVDFDMFIKIPKTIKFSVKSEDSYDMTDESEHISLPEIDFY